MTYRLAGSVLIRADHRPVARIAPMFGDLSIMDRDDQLLEKPNGGETHRSGLLRQLSQDRAMLAHHMLRRIDLFLQPGLIGQKKAGRRLN